MSISAAIDMALRERTAEWPDGHLVYRGAIDLRSQCGRIEIYTETIQVSPIQKKAVRVELIRALWEREHGPIPTDPEGTHPHRTCSNERCIAPKHRVLANMSIHRYEMLRNGSIRGVTLTIEQVKLIDEMMRHEEGIEKSSIVDKRISEEMAISVSAVRSIRYGYTWSWVTNRVPPNPALAVRRRRPTAAEAELPRTPDVQFRADVLSCIREDKDLLGFARDRRVGTRKIWNAIVALHEHGKKRPAKGSSMTRAELSTGECLADIEIAGLLRRYLVFARYANNSNYLDKLTL